jgi:hypothetical protein
LPGIALPNGAILSLDEIAFLGRLIKGTAILANVGINPDADFETAIMETRKESSGVWEVLFVKFETAPLVALHPETVKMEDRNRDTAFFHAFKLRRDSLLVV